MALIRVEVKENPKGLPILDQCIKKGREPKEDFIYINIAISEFTNYSPRIKDYIASIPEKTLKEFKHRL